MTTVKCDHLWMLLKEFIFWSKKILIHRRRKLKVFKIIQKKLEGLCVHDPAVHKGSINTHYKF